MDPDLKKTYQELSELIENLQLPVWPLEGEISRKNAKIRIANALGLDPKDPKLLERALDKINQILAGELEIESIPRNLDELLRSHEEHKKELEKQREARLKRTYPTLSEQTRKALQIKYAQDLQKQLEESEKRLAEKERVLTQNPRRGEKASQQIADELAPLLPQTRGKKGPTALSEKDYQENLNEAQSKIEQILEQAGVPEPKKNTQAFIKQATKDLSVAQEIAATPRSYEKEVLPPPRREFRPEELVLPEEVAAKLAAEPEGVAFLPVYAALQPRVAAAYIKRLPYVIPARVLKIAEVENLEWQEIIKGKFVEDLQTTRDKLIKLGLPENHPVVLSLDNKIARFLERQKTKIIRKDGTFFYKDKPAVRILKGYYDFSKRTGQYSIFDRETGVYLQSSPAPDWSGKKGYSWGLRQGLNRVGLATRMYETIGVGPGKSVIRFVFGEAKTRIYQKTVGRAVSFAVKKLAKTAVGKAVKAGVKKAATWVATKLGVQAAITAAGVATAEVSFGVSLLIAAAINLAIELGGKILGKIWDKVKSIFRDPEKALISLIGGVAIATLFSASIPLVIIGAVSAVIGGLGLLSWGAASAGTIVGGFGVNIIAFFTTLTIAPITNAITWLIVAIVGVSTVLTFFVVMTTAGAFILPVGPTEMVEDIPPPVTPPDVPPPSGLTFRWPVDSPFTCSSNYGYRILTLNGVTSCDYHEGIDIPASMGTSVYSTAEGEVISLGSSGGYGTYVVVKHNGLYSFYAHLLAVSTHIGAKVDRSTVIGLSGNSGRSTGPHLHFGFSSCGSVPDCFSNGSLTPDPCNYVSDANPLCPYDCGYRDKDTGCPDI